MAVSGEQQSVAAGAGCLEICKAGSCTDYAWSAARNDLHVSVQCCLAQRMLQGARLSNAYARKLHALTVQKECGTGVGCRKFDASCSREDVQRFCVIGHKVAGQEDQAEVVLLRHCQVQHCVQIWGLWRGCDACR